LTSVLSAQAPTAFQDATRSRQHQPQRHVRRGASLAAASLKQSQDWSAIGRAGFTYIQNCSGFCRVVSPSVLTTSSLLTGAGFGRRTFSRNSHRVAASLTQSRKQAVGSSRLIACAYSRSAGSRRARDLSAIGSGSRPAIGNSLPNQHVSQAVADRLHHHLGLSKSGSSAGFKTSWKDLTREAEALSPDDKIHD
jgi:hypothetical protein